MDHLCSECDLGSGACKQEEEGVRLSGGREGGGGKAVKQEVRGDSELSPQTVPESDARLSGTLTPPSALGKADQSCTSRLGSPLSTAATAVGLSLFFLFFFLSFFLSIFLFFLSCFFLSFFFSKLFVFVFRPCGAWVV